MPFVYIEYQKIFLIHFFLITFLFCLQKSKVVKKKYTNHNTYSEIKRTTLLCMLNNKSSKRAEEKKEDETHKLIYEQTLLL